jgi:predicted acyltransferase
VTTPPAAPVTERLAALDAFRGLTVAGMLLVNNPGSWGAIYPPLEHAAWHGWTPTDLIFPFFLFIVGITTTLSLDARRARGAGTGALRWQVVRRAAVIFACGLALAAFPFFAYTAIPGNAAPSFLDRVAWRVEHLRILGVLQRIALAYLAGGLIALAATTRQVVATVATLLLGYWGVMTLVPVPGSGLPGHLLLDQKDALLSAWLDRTVLGVDHLWSGSRTWDPEGILSTVPAVGTQLLGVLAGRWIAQGARPLAERVAGLFAVGALVAVAGSMWGWVFPINKALWTSSYVLFTGGMGAMALATCLWLMDLRQWRRWAFPFLVYGTNPLLAFLGSGVMARLMGSLITVPAADGTRPSLQAVLFTHGYASWLPPRPASLAYALSFVTVWFLLLWWAWRRGFVLKA